MSKQNQMKHLITLLFATCCFTVSAQGDIDYPYNPDFENDGFVGIEDVLELLSVYGAPFTPEQLLLDGVSLTEIIESLQSQIDSLASYMTEGFDAIALNDSLLTEYLVGVAAASEEGDSTLGAWVLELSMSVAEQSSRLDSLESLIASGESSGGQQSQQNSIPSYMYDLGDGGQGDFFLEPGQLDVPLPSGNYNSIYIPEGASAKIEPHETTVIRVVGSFVIEGFLDGSGQNTAGGHGPYNNGVHLMSSGGGKGGGFNGGYSWYDNCNFDSETGGLEGFVSESFFNVDGLGAQTSGSLDTFEGALQVFPFLHGGDGGPSFYYSSDGVSCDLPGGQGGGGLYVFASEIDISGYLWLNGGDGQGCSQSQQGNNATGGGGGGKAVLSGPEVVVSGEFRSDGGEGGGCSNTPPYAMTPAGDGQNGSLIILEW